MAAILGSVGTARADDSTIIASKGYVDAYAQKQSDRYQGTWSAATTTQKASTDLYPSMHTLEDAVGDSVNGLDYTQTATGVVKTVNQTDGLIAVTAGTVDTAEISDGAVTGDKIGTGAVTYAKVNSAAKQEAQDLSEAGATLTRWDASTAPDDKFPTVKAVAQQIADVDVSDAVQDGTNALGSDFLATTADKAPSVKAVKGMTDSLTPVTVNSSTHVASVTNAGDDTHVFTTKAVASAFANLDGLNADGTAGISAGGDVDQSTIGQAVVKVTQTDGQVKAELGTIDTRGIRNGAVTRDKVNFVANQGNYAKGWGDASVTAANDDTNNSNLGTGKASNASKDTYVPTMLAVEKYVADNTIAPNTSITASGNNNHSIVTYDENGLVTSGVSLPGLNDINTDADAACTKGAPCVLSYYVDGTNRYYKWTNMDTEGLNAVNDTTPSATTGA